MRTVSRPWPRGSARTRIKNTDVAVVVSAMADTTDDLIDLAGKIAKNPTDREMDLLLASGEQISSSLLAMAVRERGVESVALTGFQAGFVTDKVHAKPASRRLMANASRRLSRKGRLSSWLDSRG